MSHYDTDHRLNHIVLVVVSLMEDFKRRFIFTEEINFDRLYSIKCIRVSHKNGTEYKYKYCFSFFETYVI